MRAAAVCAALLAVGLAGPAVAQIDASLPDVSEVAPSAPLAIDGVWRWSVNGAKFRIQAGRSYAVTGYRASFIVNVRPGMVATRDIIRRAPGVYEGYNISARGIWRATLQPDGSLAVTVQGSLRPTRYTLTPIRIDDTAWLAREQAERGGGAAPPRTLTTRGSIYPPGWEAHLR